LPLRYLIKARVQSEITRTAQWWADNRQAAPGVLRIEPEQALALLVEHPRAGMRVRTPRPGEVRRFLLLRTHYFLYFLYYRVREQQLEVLALWHASRGAGPAV
jgi:plasmid stabilization system protein ParE